MRFRNRYLVISDATAFSAALFLLFAIRLESWSLTRDELRTAVAFVCIAVPLQLAILLLFGLYRRLWRFASVRDMEHILAAGVLSAIVSYVVGRLGITLLGLAPAAVPLSVLLPYGVISIGLAALPRLLIRMLGWHSQTRRATAKGRRVLVVGAGNAGEMVVRELWRNQDLGLLPVGFVDDDLSKQKLSLAGVPICGTLADIPRVVQRLDVSEILIAMPRAPGPVIRSVVKAASEVGVRTKIVPALFEIISGRVSITSIRAVRIDDLLRRDPIQTDLSSVADLASGRTVLVTGAGGSIGSELCRQLLALSPSRLLLLGHAENPIFDMQAELAPLAGATEIVPIIADVRMTERVREVFGRYRPQVVFHAAAHKHVPLMEQNPSEAITNNVLGTRNVVRASVEFGADRFVMISTDKAVRPTNVMGASKRVAEYVVQNAARQHGANLISVRFGNVLGSQGSVVPIFTRQIRDGGPVTVTHPEMRRYFMTIPEAVQLVMQAGAQGDGGELFMLDMGEPVRIVDLASDMIRLSGLRLGVDIDVKFTGVRPGEKLYEEMFFSHEVAEPTEHPKILRARNATLEHATDADIDALITLACKADTDDSCIRDALRRLVPDYTPQAETDPGLADPESMEEPRELGPAADALGDLVLTASKFSGPAQGAA